MFTFYELITRFSTRMAWHLFVAKKDEQLSYAICACVKVCRSVGFIRGRCYQSGSKGRSVTNRNGRHLGEHVKHDVAVGVYDIVPATFVIVREKSHGIRIL